MLPDKLSEKWIFERHPKQTVKDWLRQLRYFYFKRAWGGHANDGDEFQLAISYTDRQDLINKTGQLGLTLDTIEQPGQAIIFKHKASVWIHGNSINITITGTRDGDHYEVTDDDFKVCIDLEKHFDDLGWQKFIDKSLEKSVCCISQTKYPELYS